MVFRTAVRVVAPMAAAIGLATSAFAAEPGATQPRPAALAVSQSPAPNAFPLVTASDVAVIGVEPRDVQVVQIAADLLAGDVERVTGRKLTVGGGGRPGARGRADRHAGHRRGDR